MKCVPMWGEMSCDGSNPTDYLPTLIKQLYICVRTPVSCKLNFTFYRVARGSLLFSCKYFVILVTVIVFFLFFFYIF